MNINLKYNLLNAKSVEQEVDLISQAGQLGQITVATNMAGRGTDIVLGEGVAQRSVDFSYLVRKNMKVAGLTTNFVAVQVVKVTQVKANFSFLLKMICSNDLQKMKLRNSRKK